MQYETILSGMATCYQLGRQLYKSTFEYYIFIILVYLRKGIQTEPHDLT